jgi:ABC-type dipeptide/oligopeptide/nickel transport system permease component
MFAAFTLPVPSLLLKPFRAMAALGEGSMRFDACLAAILGILAALTGFHQQKIQKNKGLLIPWLFIHVPAFF